MIDLTIPEVEFAFHAVHQAALLARQVQVELVPRSLIKDDRSPVTVADYVSQAVTGHLFSQAFPGGHLVAEEDSLALRDPLNRQLCEQVAEFTARLLPEATPVSVCEWIDYGRVDTASSFWTLDPIDGTKGFLRGEQYAVALAWILDGQVKVGVLGCPNLASSALNRRAGDLEEVGSLVIAVRDQGAWATCLKCSVESPRTFERLSVSVQSDSRLARILRSVEAGHTNVDQIDQFGQLLGVQVPAVSMDSQAKYALLAAGQGELYLRMLSPAKPDYREKIWDQAAGSLILEEAGGQITDLDGNRLDFSTGRALHHNRGILASNGLLHSAALQALKSIMS
jgi:3'(2'), 5'-bisphosphate nucleotidase